MKKFFKFVLFLAVVGGGGYYYYEYHYNPEQAEETRSAFDTAVVERGDLRITVESTGEVEPRNRLDVKPPIAGRLEELSVDEGDTVKKGQILGWISSTERATLLDAALATSEEELEHWKKLYKPSPLVSPLKGTIIARNFEPGQSINANDAVVVIADDLIVVANLDETDIGQVKNEQVVEVALEAYPDREFSCTVEKIAYDAKTVSNVTMYEVDVRPDRLPSFARSGMTANLEFVIEEKKDVLTLPASAIQQKAGSKPGGGSRPDLQNMSPEERWNTMMERMRERGLSEDEIKERLARFAQGGGKPGGGKSGGGKPGGNSVEYYVLVASGTPEKPEQKTVTIGVSDGSYTEITAGLAEGDEVLIPRISLSSGRSGGGGNPLIPTMGSRGGGRR